MNNKKALTLYLVGALGQIFVVCIIASVLRRYGLEVGYATPLGWIIIAIGGISSALYVKTSNLWICVMTHSMINVFSQLVTGGNQYVGYFSKVVIILIAIMLATKTIRKQINN